MGVFDIISTMEFALSVILVIASLALDTIELQGKADGDTINREKLR